jgi:hypothetical protein
VGTAHQKKETNYGLKIQLVRFEFSSRIYTVQVFESEQETQRWLLAHFVSALLACRAATAHHQASN